MGVADRLPAPVRRAGRPAWRALRRWRRRDDVRRAMETVRRARGRRLILVYHRVAPRDVPRYEIVPTVPLDHFRDQIRALGALGRFEPLDALLAEPGDGRDSLRMSVTFDDDYATHLEFTLPVLRDLGVPATFFLSGRSVHGLGALWFERLEALVAERGLPATAGLLDAGRVTEEARLARLCEGDESRLALIDDHAPPGPAPLDADGMRRLVASGMTIGFHTLHHPVLPLLDGDDVVTAVTSGRDELAAAAGTDIRWLAYPHGKTDDRVVAVTREAGYTAGFTTQPRLLRTGDDPFRIGRWEPLPGPADEAVIQLATLLTRSSG